MKIVITGASGLLGWHSAGRLHAANCAALYKGNVPPYELELVDRDRFGNADSMAEALTDADAVLHFAGVNRGSDAEVAEGNPKIAEMLVAACRAADASPHIVYANSTHSQKDSVYGVSKRMAGDVLAGLGSDYTNLILPHIFGECAKPNYNNVTATLIHGLWNKEAVDINPAGRVELLHAGAAARLAISIVLEGKTGTQAPKGKAMTIVELYERLQAFHASYTENVFPNLSDDFDLALFNTYRTGGYPAHYPMAMTLRTDERGMLFESSRALGESQAFLSTTKPAQLRGDHFHIDLVERFMVVHGTATIRIRKVLTNEVQSYKVSGDKPVAIDMPPLHTHHIANDSSETVLTYFWAHRLFDPDNPDTFADPVLLEADKK